MYYYIEYRKLSIVTKEDQGRRRNSLVQINWEYLNHYLVLRTAIDSNFWIGSLFLQREIDFNPESQKLRGVKSVTESQVW